MVVVQLRCTRGVIRCHQMIPQKRQSHFQPEAAVLRSGLSPAKRGFNFMKNIITFLLLALTLPVFGANPSFQAFDANFFQVTGTGVSSIKIKTNAFTWLNAGGSGDSVWTNSGGVIQPVSTNAILIRPSGAINIGRSTNSDDGLIIRWNAALGDSTQARFELDAQEDAQTGKEAIVQIIASSAEPKATLFIEGYDAVSGDDVFLQGEFTPTSAKVTIENQVGELWRVEPTASDGTTPYRYDTSVAHSTGNLLEIANLGTNKFVIAWDGTIAEATFGTATFSNVVFLTGLRTNVAQFDVSVTDFVIGTRYTNSNRRAFVTASFTLNGAAAGTAAVTFSAEQAGVTNMVKIAAGPLASLTTIEQLSLLVGPGAFYYFTDATSGTGASVAIVAGTSSRTDW